MLHFFARISAQPLEDVLHRPGAVLNLIDWAGSKQC